MDDVGQAANYALAARGLLAGRTVTGLLGIEHGAVLSRLGIGRDTRAGQRLKHTSKLGIECRQVARGLAGNAALFHRIDLLGAAHVGRIAAAERKLGQAQRVGAEGARLARGNELVGRSDRVHDLGAHLEQDIVAEGLHRGPRLNVGAFDQLVGRLRLAKAPVHALFVRRVVKGVLAGLVPSLLGQVGRRRQDAAIGSRRRNGASVHQGHGAQLAIARLGTLAVGEVARSVADGQAVVGGRVAGTEARAAECRTHNRAGLHKVVDVAAACKLECHGLARGIDRQRELAAAGVGALEHAGSLDHGVVVAARAASDNALLHVQLAVDDLVEQAKVRLALADLSGLELHLVQDVLEVLVELVDLKAVGRMERQCDHGLDARQVDLDAAVVVGDIGGLELAVVVAAAVHGQKRVRVLVGGPDARQAGGLGGHDIDAVAVVGRHARNARAHKLHDLVLNVAPGKDGADDGKRHIVRADAGTRGAREVDGDNAGIGNIVGVTQQLLCQLAAALAHGHGAQGAVAGVRVGAQDHLAATGEVLTHKGVDDGDVRRDEDAAVLLGCGKAKDVVVLVDGAAHGAQRVMAVGEHVGQRELLHARGARRLDDANEGDVVARHGIETNLECLGVAGRIVCLEDRIRDGATPGILRCLRNTALGSLGRRHNLAAAAQVDAVLVQLDHTVSHSARKARAHSIHSFNIVP